MKNTIFLFIGILLLLCSNGSGNNNTAIIGDYPVNSLRISCTPDLADLMETWIREYGKVNPEVHIELVTFTGSQNNVFPNGGADLFFISNENHAALPDDSVWTMVVGREAIVPIVNSKNPFLNKINHQGVSSEALAQLFIDPMKPTWGVLLGNGQETPVHYYMINSETIKSHVAAFLAMDQSAMKGIPVKNGKEMISAIQKDPYGIGFCEMVDVLDLGNQCIADNIRLLPIDKNKNGIIDYFENIYSDVNVFMRGVWIGKYPKTLCRAIYSIAPGQTPNKNKIAFLTWVLNDGQRFLNPIGYSDLAYSDGQKKKLDMLTGSQTNVSISSGVGFFMTKLNDVSIISFIIIILVPFLLGYMTLEAIVREKRRKKATEVPVPLNSTRFINENSVVMPNGLFLTRHIPGYLWRKTV